ncbi:MAG: Asp23/Gls24 family envelope stress response protein [Mycobacteriales bacterium]
MDPERVAAAVRGCPAVARLSSGQFGEVASYLPNQRVDGVRTLAGDDVEVHVVLWYGIPVEEAVAQVRAAVRAAAPDVVAVDVVVADLAHLAEAPGGVP